MIPYEDVYKRQVLVMAVVASYVWPVAAAGINALTGVMASAGAFGVFLYGFLNRVLIPTGLHQDVYKRQFKWCRGILPNWTVTAS